MVSSYTTSKAGSRFLHKDYRFQTKQEAEHDQHTIKTPISTLIEIDRTKHYQSIIGFGGTLTDATVIMISKLPQDLQNQLLRDYFSPNGGVNYNLCRIPIGSPGASTRPYSLDDVPEGSEDDTLKLFALQPEDDQRVLYIFFMI